MQGILLKNKNCVHENNLSFIEIEAGNCGNIQETFTY